MFSIPQTCCLLLDSIGFLDEVSEALKIIKASKRAGGETFPVATEALLMAWLLCPLFSYVIGGGGAALRSKREIKTDGSEGL